MFQDTLASNVAYGQEIDIERVNRALDLADASSFVSSLENGIETLMSEAGTNLSGGQRQRVAIARAIYKHSSLILFDEATSALDDDTESKIMDAIYGISKDKTLIIIAHRLSTLNRCEKIYKLRDGEIENTSIEENLK